MKNKIIAISLIGLFFAVFITSILLLNKYKSFRILSIKKEYNVVSTKETTDIEIPIYFEKNNSFLTKKKTIKSSYIENDSNRFMVDIKSVDEGIKIKYESVLYYEFVFIVSFSSYDDFSEPLFLEDACFTINYQNGEKMSYEIGNVEIYLNTTEDKTNIQLMSSEAVVNNVEGKDVIVGLNISLRNDNNDSIKINKIKTLNKFYEYDYINYLKDKLSYKQNLLEKYDNSYSYTTQSLSSDDLNLEIKSKETCALFVPLRYLNGVRYVDNLPIFIEYTIKGVKYVKVIDSFTYMSMSNFYSKNGLKLYEYSYK